MEKKLTEGKIAKPLLLFAVPIFLSSLIQQLYNTVDLVFVGTFLESRSAAAVGASSLIASCMVSFFTGLSVGATVIVAQIFGASDTKNIEKAIGTSISLSILGGGILSAIGFFGSSVFLRWMNTPQGILEEASAYLRIYFISIVFLIIYDMGAGILRALGDSKGPMEAQLAGGILNVILDVLFVVVLKKGINWVAYATVIAQVLAAFMILIRINRLEYKGQYLKIDWGIFSKIIKIGIPAGIQTLVITVSNVFVQYCINGYGIINIAAFTAYFKIELFIYLPIIALGQAITAFSGQNTGAGDYVRVKQGAKICICIGFVFTVLISAALIVFRHPVFYLFNREEAVIESGMKIMCITFPFYWLYVVLEILGDTIRGAGKVMPPMIIILVNLCVVRTIILFIVNSFYQDVRAVAVTYPITWALAAGCMLAYFWRGKWMEGADFKNWTL